MPTVYLSPIGNQQFVDTNGNPLSGGKLYSYAAGSTSARTTYTDSTGATPQANPIILNSLGRPANPIWLQSGQTKLVLYDSADNLVQTWDNVSGINDVSLAASEWTSSGLTPTYISGTSFSFPGDQTAQALVGRRINSSNTAGTIYSRITVASFGAGITTITVANDSGTLDSGLSSVSYAVLTPTNPSVPALIDSITRFMDDSDKSKLLALQLANITTATLRTLTVPDASGTLALAGNAQSTLGSVAGTNTITAALTPVALAAYVPGQQFTFVPANTNTGATTINVDSLGAKNLFCGGAACVGGEIRQNVPVTVEYDGTQFNIIGPYVGGNLPTGQIKFPSTQNASSDANTLDDYEEGTWTPSITSSGGGAATYSTQTGRYIKIGKQVFCSGVIDLATAGTLGAGTISVSGFPFTVNNSVASRATGACSWANFATSFINVLLRMAENTTTADVVGATAATATNSNVSVANFGGTGGIRFGVTYEASA